MVDQSLKLHRHSVLSNPHLRNLRNSLRQIIVIATNDEINRLMKLEKEHKGKGYKRTSSSQFKEGIKIYRKHSKLHRALISSICLCANSAGCITRYNLKNEGIELPQFITDLDMVFDSESKKWFCTECFKALKYDY